MRRDENTTAEEAANELSSEIKGKTVIITGPSAGSVGIIAATAIARHSPASLILAGRSQKNLDEAVKLIKTEVPHTNLDTLVLDLASLASVRKAADQVLKRENPIDVVICSAGVMATAYEKTVDGYELQFQACHLGHFAFIEAIKPKLFAAKAPRVITVSSSGHGISPVLFDDIGFSDGSKYDRWASYGQAKSANLLHARGLAAHYGQQGLLAFAVTPGANRDSGIFRHLDEAGWALMQQIGMVDQDRKPIEGPKSEWRKIECGASTYIVAAFDPSIAGQNGSYLVDCAIHEELAQDHVKDPAIVERLWKVSEEMIAGKI